MKYLQTAQESVAQKYTIKLLICNYYEKLNRKCF